MGRFLIAMTGASGAPYFLRLLERLHAFQPQPAVEYLISEAGCRVLWEETGLKPQDLAFAGFSRLPIGDVGARAASGSARCAGMVIVPCSMSTLATIACGTTANLIHRAAAVQLKEGRKLVVVPRESPLSLIHLRAMVSLREAGALILPAMPAFYHRPATVAELVDSVVDRILDHLDLADEAIRRWQGTP
jgi:4-hydroxy-3-polyprenylbenzoate decarboxylase